jgi:hypothetical protein
MSLGFDILASPRHPRAGGDPVQVSNCAATANVRKTSFMFSGSSTILRQPAAQGTWISACAGMTIEANTPHKAMTITSPKNQTLYSFNSGYLA